MKIHSLILAAMLCGNVFTNVHASDVPLNNVKIKGLGFFRHEMKKNADYKAFNHDKVDFNQTRLNLSLQADIAEDYGYVVFTPQFSHISGKTDYVSNVNTNQSTSGVTYNPRMDVYEAFIAVQPLQTASWKLFLGRQELAYGDHLVLGSVPWSYVGRSFDAVRTRYEFSEQHKLDLFSSKIAENNSTASVLPARDSDFHGIYYQGDFGSSLNQADLYILNKANSTAGDFRDTYTFGSRLKSKIADSAFDYRFEGALQKITLWSRSGYQNAYQYDVELGYAHEFMNSRFGIEHFNASKNYDQLFPTGHKFMGFADQFSRRNIRGIVLHYSMKPVQKLTILADYHLFFRSNKNTPAFNATGGSLGAVGNAKGVANELDLVVNYDFSKMLQLSVGHSWVMLGDYIKNQSPLNNAQTRWAFAQMHVKF